MAGVEVFNDCGTGKHCGLQVGYVGQLGHSIVLAAQSERILQNGHAVNYRLVCCVGLASVSVSGEIVRHESIVLLGSNEPGVTTRWCVEHQEWINFTEAPRCQIEVAELDGVILPVALAVDAVGAVVDGRGRRCGTRTGAGARSRSGYGRRTQRGAGRGVCTTTSGYTVGIRTTADRGATNCGFT